MGVYERQLRQETILNTAAEVFCANGFGDTKMSHIARKAQLSKGLIYFYYKSKDDLYMAVILHAIKRTIVFQKEVMKANQHKNGLERLMDLLEEYFVFMREYPYYQDAISTFINMTNPLKRHSNTSGLTKGMKESPYYAQVKTQKFETFRLITQAIVEGNKDGSIKTQLPPVYLYLSIWSLMIGYEKLSIHEEADTAPEDAGNYIFDNKQWQDTIRQIVRTVLTTNTSI